MYSSTCICRKTVAHEKSHSVLEAPSNFNGGTETKKKRNHTSVETAQLARHVLRLAQKGHWITITRRTSKPSTETSWSCSTEPKLKRQHVRCISCPRPWKTIIVWPENLTHHRVSKRRSFSARSFLSGLDRILYSEKNPDVTHSLQQEPNYPKHAGQHAPYLITSRSWSWSDHVNQKKGNFLTHKQTNKQNSGSLDTWW